MFLQIFKFELSYWFKKPLIYIFLLVNFALVFAAISIENVSIGESLGNINVNAPYAIFYYVSFMTLLSILMTTTFMNKVALKDFQVDFFSILFTTSVKRESYILGRFCSGLVLAIFSLLGVYLAFMALPFVPHLSEKIGSTPISVYLASFFLFVLPNTLLIGSVIYGLAIKFRSTTASFVGAIFLLLVYLTAGNFVKQLNNEELAILLDPLGIHSLSVITKYWTIADKNTLSLGLSGPFLLNRIIWISFSVGMFIWTFWSTKLNVSSKSKKKKQEEESPSLAATYTTSAPLPIVKKFYDLRSKLLQFNAISNIDFWTTVKSPAFIAIAIFAMINMTMAVSKADYYFGSANHPTTYYVLQGISNSFFLFITVIITYYSGVMIWRDRSAHMDQLVDTTSHDSIWTVGAKYFSMIKIIGVFMLVATFVGMSVQVIKGYYNLEPLLYIKQLFLIDGTTFAVYAAVAFFIHAIVNNQYLGYFLFIVFGIVNTFGWSGLDIDSNLLIVGGVPDFKYSDMYGYTPFVSGLVGYSVYWLLFGGVLLFLSSIFWVRGNVKGFKNRVKQARLSLNNKTLIAGVILCGLWVATGSFLFYNAEVLNSSFSDDEEAVFSVDYEKKYKQYDGIPQPRITAIDYVIDVYPEDRSVLSEMDIVLTNKHDHAIDSIHFTCPRKFTTTLEVSNAKRVLHDELLDYHIYKLDQPLPAGGSIVVKAKTTYEPQGIENQLTSDRITQNGTFIDKSSLLPVIGYAAYRQLDNNDKRKENGLKPTERAQSLHANCSAACSNSYIASDADWITMNTTISTSASQTAIAPGSLVKQWKEGGRNYYRYEVNQPVLNFCSFLSAEYEVKREKWNGIDMEVYYHKGHAYNVDRMMTSLRKSLEYNATAFIPYPFQQARIIEFPRFDSFAQAFPGTMPYSESMGFLSDMRDEDDIDRSFFTVAHEMAHQWWGHQIVPANVQGGTMLAESFAQYSALMVMEKEYGKAKMKEFLKYEMDSYLRSRGSEETKEMPLLYVENQAYIHYRKGSVVMYALGQYIGEDNLNKAMQSYAKRFVQAEPPYPTSLDFMDEVDRVTPDSLKYLVDDLFRKIVLFSNKVEDVSYEELSDGTYQVEMNVSSEKFEADEVGKESLVELDDYIYIGVYGDEENLIYYQRHQLNKKENTISVIVNEKPRKGGIDPLNLLIDKVPADNVRAF